MDKPDQKGAKRGKPKRPLPGTKRVYTQDEVKDVFFLLSLMAEARENIDLQNRVDAALSALQESRDQFAKEFQFDEIRRMRVRATQALSDLYRHCGTPENVDLALLKNFIISRVCIDKKYEGKTLEAMIQLLRRNKDSLEVQTDHLDGESRAEEAAENFNSRIAHNGFIGVAIVNVDDVLKLDPEHPFHRTSINITHFHTLKDADLNARHAMALIKREAVGQFVLSKILGYPEDRVSSMLKLLET